jgi:hypothetical protein
MELGPYVIQRPIAVGGMAEIFLARHQGVEGLERTVVIKRVLPEHGSDDEFVTMFLDEARLLAALSHPNIAQVFDLGWADEAYFLVMEYVRGPTLGALLKGAADTGRELTQRVALSIGLSVCEALAYVHGRHDEFGRPLEIVHRDINPANVIVSYEGAVKLIDFGIAKAASKVHETRTGVVKGTFGYVAPEQITLRESVDHRADVYALGVLLYEMCVGHHPFTAGPIDALVKRMVSGDFRRPSEVVPGFPSELDQLIVECLSPAPANRPQGVGELTERLAAFMGSEGLVVTMSEIGAFANDIVPDTQGPMPLKPMRSSQVLREANQPGAGTELQVEGTVLKAFDDDVTVPAHAGALAAVRSASGTTGALGPPAGARADETVREFAIEPGDSDEREDQTVPLGPSAMRAGTQERGERSRVDEGPSDGRFSAPSEAPPAEEAHRGAAFGPAPVEDSDGEPATVPSFRGKRGGVNRGGPASQPPALSATATGLRADGAAPAGHSAGPRDRRAVRVVFFVVLLILVAGLGLGLSLAFGMRSKGSSRGPDGRRQNLRVSLDPTRADGRH